MFLRASLIMTAATLALASPAAAQFIPGPNPVTGTVGAQTQTGGTAEVKSGGSVTTSGSTVSVTISGTSTLNNAGSILQTGTGRAIDNNLAGAKLTIDNSGTISAAGSDAFRVNKGDSSVSMTNSGTVSAVGGEAIDWAAITTAVNQLTNAATGIVSATGADAIRPGQNGLVTNHGTITATPTVSSGTVSGSDGIDLRVEKTVTVVNHGSITGRHGIATDGANVGPLLLTVDNKAGGMIQALNGSGLNVDGVNATVKASVTNAFGATIQGGVLAAATSGDGDGIDVDGVLTLKNSGNVLGRGAKGVGSDGGSNNAEGIAAGGGTITNTATGRIIGSTAIADAPNGDPTRIGTGILIDNSSGGNAIAATKIDNAGLIQGQSGAAVRIVGTFDNEITNASGGTLQGAGTVAAVQTGDGADMLKNAGLIVGGSGGALDMQGGNDTVTIQGGGVTGTMRGGGGVDALAFDLGTKGTFTVADSVTEFESLSLKSGTTTLSGANRVADTTNLNLDGGTLAIAGVAGAGLQGFACLSLSASSGMDLGLGTSVSFSCMGTVALNETLGIWHYNWTTSPDYVIRILGDQMSNADFLRLVDNTTVNGEGVRYSFDGTYTNVQTPEPGAMALLGSALAGLLAMRRRATGR